MADDVKKDTKSENGEAPLDTARTETASADTARAGETPAESTGERKKSADEPLLSPVFMGKLKQLQIVSRKVFRGRMKGERRSKKRGQSVEFADFRNYVAGDDPRFIDWNTYGRLERLYLKLFMEEEDLFVYILVDCSASMSTAGGLMDGAPVSPAEAAAAAESNGGASQGGAGGDKFHYARALAAAIAYISALNQDHIAVGGFRGGLTDVLRPKRGKGQAPKVIDFLQNLRAEGTTNLAETVRRYVIENRRPGLMIVISDFLDPAGYEEGLKMLQARKFDVFAMQVLTPQELDPDLRGDLRLVDAETGQTTEVSITPRLLQAYKQAVAEYCEGLADFCAKRGMGYLLANTGADLEDLILKYFRTAGLVK